MDVRSDLAWQSLRSSTSDLHGSLGVQIHLARVHRLRQRLEVITALPLIIQY